MAGLRLCGQEPEEQKSVGRKCGKCQRSDRRRWPGHRVDRMACGSCGPNELVAGIRNERCSSIRNEGNRLATELRDDALAFGIAAVVIIAAHRHFGADMGEELRRYPRVLHQYPAGIPQGFSSAHAKVPEIADRSCDNMQSRWQA